MNESKCFGWGFKINLVQDYVSTDVYQGPVSQELNKRTAHKGWLIWFDNLNRAVYRDYRPLVLDH